MDKSQDEEIMRDWYQYAAEREGSVDSYLRVLRNRQRLTVAQQQSQYGATDDEFKRLQGFRLPRPNSFAKDARRIAEACHLKHPKEFVNAMLMVFRLTQGEQVRGWSQSYQAAFDDTDELDKPDQDE